MRFMIMATAAMAALSIGAPAAAQYSRGGNRDDVEQLRMRLETDIGRGIISPDRAAPLRAQLRQLVTLNDQYRQQGFVGHERADLDARIDNMDRQIDYAEQMARYGRNYGRSSYEGYDRGGSYGQSGNDSQGIHSYGRGTDDQDGGYSQDNYGGDDQGGYGNDASGSDQGYDDNRDDGDDYTAVDNGSDDSADDGSDGGYGSGNYDDNGPDDRSDVGNDPEVGQRATADLGPVPIQYRSLYHDGDGYAYRYRDGDIYQVDSATQRIVRIYRSAR
jgi:hypothetical protein